MSYSSNRYSGYTSPYLKRSDSQSSAGRRDSGYQTRFNPPASRYGDVDKYSKYRLNAYKSRDMSQDVPEAFETTEEQPMVEQLAEETPEVLHESDVEDFQEDVKPVESEPVIEEEVLEHEPEIEDEIIREAEQHEIEEEVVEEAPEPEAEQELIGSPEPPVEYKAPSPLPKRRSLVENDENKETPKKLNSGVWPPVEDGNLSKQVVGAEERPNKKRVSDLIARFNTCTVENDGSGKTDARYKQEYGATGSAGKINSEVFH